MGSKLGLVDIATMDGRDLEIICPLVHSHKMLCVDDHTYIF